MESAVVNLLSPGDRILVLNTGNFADRFQKIAEIHGIETVVVEYEWGANAKAADVEKALADDPSIKGVFVQHSETSTGIVNDVEAIGARGEGQAAALRRRRDLCRRRCSLARGRVGDRRLHRWVSEGVDDAAGHRVPHGLCCCVEGQRDRQVPALLHGLGDGAEVSRARPAGNAVHAGRHDLRRVPQGARDARSRGHREVLGTSRVARKSLPRGREGDRSRHTSRRGRARVRAHARRSRPKVSTERRSPRTCERSTGSSSLPDRASSRARSSGSATAATTHRATS